MTLEEERAIHEMELSTQELSAEAHALKAEAEALQTLLASAFETAELSQGRAKQITRKLRHVQNGVQSLYNTHKHTRETWTTIRRLTDVDT